jgi:hypothetical protein
MQSTVLASIGAAQLHVPKPTPALLQTWWLEHPPGPVQGTEAPGTQSRVLASTDEAHSQGPKPLPFVLQTWLLEHPPGPAHATEAPGMHAVATEASVDAFVPLASGDSPVTPPPQPPTSRAAASTTRLGMERQMRCTESR